MMPRSSFLFVTAWALLGVACTSTAPTLEPPLEPEPTPDVGEGWVEIAPGGTTGCARDTPFSWWIHGGSENKIVLDFMGGGACWDSFTCSIADAIFNDSVAPVRNALETQSFQGIYDRENPANPFADWHHVVIPYCTGDIHWGDAEVTYGEGSGAFDIDHVGARNARAVLDWVFTHFTGPEQILITGCSAGSYGAALWAARVMEEYPESNVVQFGDSGAGIITDSFFADSFPVWNAEQAFPAWIPELDPARNDLLDKSLPDLYAGIAGTYPDQWMSQFNTVNDGTQVFYYEAMGGGTEEEWSRQMRDSLVEIENRVDNFRAFTADGTQHCVITDNSFYTLEADGVRVLDWLMLLLDEGAPESVQCAGCEAE